LMLEAVLFDGGDTLVGWTWDDRLLAAGHDAGLRALGREPSPELTARFRAAYLPLLQGREDLDEVDYPALMRRLLGELGIEPSGEELDRFLAAEHAAWAPARRVGDEVLELLDALRARGLRLGLVSNSFDPGWLVRGDLARWGLAERLDAVVLSSEVGKRKPHPEPFERALAALGVDPGRALFVGDSRYHDVQGAAEAGMATVQALWFRADDDPRGRAPDHLAAAPADVLEIVDAVATT
ncbi:MAG: HAD family hydrolase, partial [Gaiellaceae bacterium]